MLIICFISTLPITGIKYTSDRLGAQIKWTGEGTPDNLIHCSAEGCGTSTSTTFSTGMSDFIFFEWTVKKDAFFSS